MPGKVHNMKTGVKGRSSEHIKEQRRCGSDLCPTQPHRGTEGKYTSSDQRK